MVESISRIHGFRSFLQPPSFRELLWAAEAGPVIIINISNRRSDAIILVRHRSSPVVVPLPDAQPEDVEVLARRFESEGADLNEEVAFEVLIEIWTRIVEPVADTLNNVLHIPTGSRVWWLAMGAASRLPLHAAGPYEENRAGMLNLFVSSYTPSLSALIRARTAELEEDVVRSPKILAVAQAAAPGQTQLAKAADELQHIRDQSQKKATCTIYEGEAGKRANVLEAIATHSWVHLICHGHHDPRRPFSSHFSLEDGPLSLLSLLKQNLPLAELAVLSACHSAKVNEALPDEALHLAAGMMVAGFRSVVATMWALDDEIAPLVMKEFYAEMLPKDGDAKRPVDAAIALKRAVEVVGRMTRPGPDGDEVPVLPFMQRINFVHYGI